jgi:3-dehydroquinate synthetase
MRVSAGALERLGRDLRIIVGRPRKAVLVVGDDVDADLVRDVERNLTDGRFFVHVLEVPHGRTCRRVDAMPDLYASLDGFGVTSEDALVAMGDVDVCSCAAYLATTWCGGMPFALVPLTLDAVVECVATPHPLDVGESTEMVSVVCRAQMLVCDLDLVPLEVSPETLRARAIMVASAVAGSPDAFSSLAGDADAILSGDVAAIQRQLLTCGKTRGRLISATSLAVRQGVGYGVTFERALASCLPADAVAAAGPGRLLAEGIRFASRLAVGVGEGDVDMVFAQDALLDKLGLAEVPCSIEPGIVLAAIKEAGLKRTNRYLFALPLAVGRVRLTAVPDEVMDEHLGAWCASRSRLATAADKDEHSTDDEGEDL